MTSIKRTSEKQGLPPGTIVHVGEMHGEEVTITIIDYTADDVTERTVKKVEECFAYRDRTSVTWINVSSLHDVELIEKLGAHFGIHPLVLEDIANTRQRPKLEDMGDYIFIAVKMLERAEDDGELVSEHVSIILGKGVVISFQEREGDVFDTVRDRIRTGKGRIRRMGADYLAYSLLDAIVDNYFTVIEELGEQVEQLEDELLESADQQMLQTLHVLKRSNRHIRRSIWPLREVANTLTRGDLSLIEEPTIPYLRDLYDHTVQVIDTVEGFRDTLASMMDLYLSNVSNRMNEVMKVLTIIATVFIPMTFIAGVYGMNFQNMPELAWPNGYYMALTAMAATGLVMLGHFRRKGWL